MFCQNCQEGPDKDGLYTETHADTLSGLAHVYTHLLDLAMFCLFDETDNEHHDTYYGSENSFPASNGSLASDWLSDHEQADPVDYWDGDEFITEPSITNLNSSVLADVRFTTVDSSDRIRDWLLNLPTQAWQPDSLA
jgi:hypothetical protein